MSDNTEVRTYGEGQVYLEEGWYKIKSLITDLQAYSDVQEKRGKELMEDLIKEHEKDKE